MPGPESGMDEKDLGIKQSPRDTALEKFNVDLTDAVATRQKLIELQNDTAAVSELGNLVQDHEAESDIAA